MARVEGPDLNATLRPGGPPAPRVPRPKAPPAGSEASGPVAAASAPRPAAPPPNLPEDGDPNATVHFKPPPTEARPDPAARPAEPKPRAEPPAAPDPAATAPTSPAPRSAPPSPPSPPPRRAGTGSTLEVLLNEVRALRRAQEEILELLKGGAADRSVGGDAAGPARRRRGRYVLLVDDDADTAAAAGAALEAGSIEVRAVPDGNRCLAAVAERRPDVVVLEVGIGGSMPGRDVINMIKATMEWVDIPIVLFTREGIVEEDGALREFSADAIIPKAPGAELELAQRVGELLAAS